MINFIQESLSPRIIFGPGRLAQLRAEAECLGMKRLLVLSTPGRKQLAQQVAELLGELSVGIYAKSTLHVPGKVVSCLATHLGKLQIDGCVAVGGGSTIGLAKMASLKFNTPYLAIPTTFSGSEMTPIWGTTNNNIKTTGRDQIVLPRTVIYDPELSLSLPSRIAAASGMNAIAHCVEALYSDKHNPLASLLAREGIRILNATLTDLDSCQNQLEVRAAMLLGSYYAGMSLAASVMGIHHKICHVLGGSFNLSHSEVHAVILPYALAFNSRSIPEAVALIENALSCPKNGAPQALFELNKQVGLPISLRALGMHPADLEKAAELIISGAYTNPRPINYKNISALLESAFFGLRPSQPETDQL